MNTSIMNEFYIIGISVRTTNENNQVAKDIPALWERFMVEGIIDKIPNKIDGTIYCLYTDYESDHTKPYTTILGCKVATIENVPDGMVAKHIEAGHYGEINLQGNLLNSLVYNAWISIWNANLDRKFTTDYEVYAQNNTDMTNAVVDIFISLN